MTSTYIFNHFSKLFVLCFLDIACPVTHGLLPVIEVAPRESSDYGSASSISSATSVAHHKDHTIAGNDKLKLYWNRVKKAMKIKRMFLPAKATYFFFYMARSLFAVYFMLFLTSTGLDPEQAGSIHGIRMVVITLSTFFWGFLTDKSGKDLLIVSIKFISFAIIVLLKPFVAYWITTRETVDEHRQHIQEAVQHTLKHLNTTHNLTDIMRNSDEVITKTFGLTWTVNHYTTGDTPLYLLMLILGVFSAFAGGALHVLLDSKVQSMTKQHSSSNSAFGRQRLWGSLAYAFGPLLSGAVLESAPVNEVSQYMPAFYLHFTFMMLGLICCIILFKQKPKSKPKPTVIVGSSATTQAAPTPPSSDPIIHEPIGKLVLRMVRSTHMVLFFLNVLLMGVANGLQWSFQYLLMEELGMPKTFMGLCSLTQCLMESLLFPIGIRIIKAIGGNEVARTIGLFSYSILFLIFSLCPNPSFFPLGTMFGGLGFTIYFIAAMDELYYVGNPSCMISLYALYNSIMVGLGSGISGILGGILYKTIGGQAMYFLAAIFYLTMAALSTVYTILYKKSVIKGWDRSKIYTKFTNYVSYSSSNTKGSTPEGINQVKSDDAISLTIDGESSL